MKAQAYRECARLMAVRALRATIRMNACSATIWVKAGDNQDECPDRAVGA